jgi:hypothetical protein
LALVPLGTAHVIRNGSKALVSHLASHLENGCKRCMRVLIAITPAMYQQTLALFLKEYRPSAKVETTDLANLNPEVERFGPDLLICHETSTEIRKRVFSWIEIRYTNSLDAIVSVEGKETRIEDIDIEELLGVLDQTEELVSAR